MATVKEMMMDAAASIETAAMMSAGDTFEGTLSSKFDEDWIRIEMTAGMLYTIDLKGADTDGVTDTILKLYDAKGGFIKQNDDKDGAKGELDSTFQFVPDVSGTYYISAGAYTANLGQMNQGAYTVTVTEMVAGLPDPIEGTDGDDKLRGTDVGEKISGGIGNDSLFGLGGNDTLNGGPGNDLLVGGMGGDTLNGGADEDTISYNTSLEGVTINLTDGTARGGDADGDIIGDDIENVVGSGQDDMLTGNREENELHGLGGADMLDGDEGNDTLNGGAGDDVLDGGDEDDELEGGPGADTLTGGQGMDTVSYAGSMMGVEVRLHSGKVDGGDAKGDVFADTTTNTYVIDTDPDPDEEVTEEVTETVPDFINIIGSGMADVLAGDSRDNEIMGGGGDDMIFGGPGGSYDDSDNEDTLHGQGGNDKIYGGKGNDTLDGGPGNDLLVGGSGADTYTGGPGNDMIYADRADVAAGEGIHGHNVPTAADGDDPDGDMGKMAGEMDTLSFAKFMDQMLEDGTGITLNLEAGTTADGPDAGSDPDSISITNINRLIGTSEDDMLTGTDDAPETIEGGGGRDTLVGGSGPGDTVSYASSDRGVDVELGDTTTSDATGSDASGGHARGDTISGFENVMGSAFGDDLTAVTGTAGETGSTLWGLDGDDELEGGLGNDTLEGGAGADELDGGTQDRSSDESVPNTQINTLSYAMSDYGVRVNLATASASGGDAEGDEIATYDLTIGTGDDEQEVEVATFVNVTGSARDDHLTGDMFANHLTGGGGNDSLRGGAGADVLEGGPGADMLDGGEDAKERNNTVPDGDDGDTDPDPASEDWAAYRGAAEGVTVNLHAGEGTAGEAEGDELKNIELIWGSQHNDTFIASAGHDVIHGDGGSDTVSYEASRHGVTVVLPAVDDTGGTGTAQWTAATDPDGTPGSGDETPAMFNPATDPVVDSWRGGDLDTRAERTAAGSSYEVQADDDDTTTKSYAEGDILASIENVTGSRRDDMITGDAVPNVLKGGAGRDNLNGGGEADKLYGGEGNDILGARDTDDDGTVNDDSEAGDDMLMGGAGDDRLYGGTDDDTLNGGPGSDDLDGGDGDDTFVFTQDGRGSDVILDFTFEPGTQEDRIDLSAFNIDEDDLVGLLSERAGSVILNLEQHGGGRITISGADLDDFDTATDTVDGVDQSSDGVIQMLSVRKDLNGDGDIGGTVDGVAETDGIFIL